MAKFRGIISVVAVLAFLFSCVPANAADVTVSKKVTVNVAKHKPVTVSAERYPNAQLGPSITDDNLTSSNFWFAIVTSEVTERYDGKNWAVIDLLRPYRLNKIILFDRADSDGITLKGNFRILVSNDKDFMAGSYDMIATRGAYTAGADSEFPNRGNIVFLLNGNKSYRYVKYEKTANTAAQVREIQAFADITVTEVSRGAAAYSTPVSGQKKDEPYAGVYGAGNLEDGDTNTAWMTATATSTDYDGKALAGVYPAATIDLGTQYPIGMVELYNRKGHGNTAAKGNFAVYGSNNPVLEAEMSGTVSGSDKKYYMLTHDELVALTSNKYKPLMYRDSITSTYTLSDGTTVNNFPDDPDTGCYQITVDDSEKFQYIVYRRVKDPAQVGTLSEFRAYVINPEVYGIEVVNNTVTINFSEDMDASTFEDGITVLDVKTGECLSDKADIQAGTDDAQCVLTLNGVYNTKIKVVISTEVTNTKGVALSEAVEYTFVAEKGVKAQNFKITDSKEGTGAEVTSLSGKTELGTSVSVTNLSADLQKVILFLCLYNDKGSLVGIKTAEQTIMANAATTLVAGLDLPAGVTEAGAYLLNGYKDMLLWSDGISVK